MHPHRTRPIHVPLLPQPRLTSSQLSPTTQLRAPPCIVPGNRAPATRSPHFHLNSLPPRVRPICTHPLPQPGLTPSHEVPTAQIRGTPAKLQSPTFFLPPRQARAQTNCIHPIWPPPTHPEPSRSVWALGAQPQPWLSGTPELAPPSRSPPRPHQTTSARGFKNVSSPHIDRKLVSALGSELPVATIILLLEHIAISKCASP